MNDDGRSYRYDKNHLPTNVDRKKVLQQIRDENMNHDEAEPNSEYSSEHKKLLVELRKENKAILKRRMEEMSNE